LTNKKGGSFLLLIISCLIAFLFLCVVFVTFLFIENAARTRPKPTEGLPPKRHSDLDLFLDGRLYFDALEKEIAHAEHHIHLSSYIFRYDDLGKTILHYLQNKAKEGVEVRLLLDYIGQKIPQKVRLELAAAGIDLQFSRTPSFLHPISSINRRNHRKIAVIDGRIGFFGGYNVGDEYLGKKSEFGQWRDYHLLLRGENVQDLQRCFLEDWEKATGQVISGKAYYPDLNKGETLLRIVPTPNAALLEDEFIRHLSRATDNVFIGSPYFIPSDRLLSELVRLLDRGISLTLLLPAKRDHPLVKPLSYHFLEPLLKKGANIYQYYLGFYHAKVVIVDDTSCYFGTGNFDRRSLFLNEEIGSFIYNQTLISEIVAKTQKDLMQSKQVTLEELRKRSFVEKGKTALSHPFAPLL
jgi:cardiolipin synthase